MNFYKLIKKIAFLTLIIANASFASDDHPLSNFKNLPKPLCQYMFLNYLSYPEWNSLRLVSKDMKDFVDEKVIKVFEAPFRQTVEEEFGNNKDTTLKDLLTDNPKISVLLSKNHYTNKIMQEICDEYLKKDGFLCVSQGSDLEEYLSENYTLVFLFDYLQNHLEEIQNLFLNFFGKKIPEGQEKQALNFLTACLPSNHIYMKFTRRNIDSSMKKFTDILLKNYKNKGIKYFLFGIDQDYTVLNDKEHVIVINEPTRAVDLKKLIDFPHETIILNTNELVFCIGYLPPKVKNLILVNGNNKCCTFETFLMSGKENLEEVIVKGLMNITSIGMFFFSDCPNLVRFIKGDLLYVELIETGAFEGCKNLDGEKIKHELLMKNKKEKSIREIEIYMNETRNKINPYTGEKYLDVAVISRTKRVFCLSDGGFSHCIDSTPQGLFVKRKKFLEKYKDFK